MKSSIKSILILGIILSGISISMLSIALDAKGTDSTLLFSVLLGIMSLVFIYFLILISSKNHGLREKLMYSIAIIGLPQSGKTTFITSTFGAVMYGKIGLKGYKAIVKGNSTIDRINQNLSLLDRGIPIGATTDQTLFAYRLNLEEQSSFFVPTREYQVEFGDFQGDMTQDLIDRETNIWRHDSEFFSWVKDANAFVLIVDLGKYSLDKESYVPEISKSLRSAWQKILELNDYRKKEILKQPVVLIFNKVDLLAYNMEKADIEKLAFSNERLPELSYLDLNSNEYDIVGKIKNIEDDFENLINFFTINCPNFGYYFYSSFIKDKYEHRQGLNAICNKIFPVNIRDKSILSF